MSMKSLGDYAIIKELGQGTLGTLFLAEHRFLKRPFALKVLPEEIVKTPGFVERFEKEVATLSLLDHPHIVKVHNISFAEDRYFLVTDCIVNESSEAINLFQYMQNRKGPLKEEEVYQIAAQIASALDYVHQQQVGSRSLAHRSLKLSNVLVRKTAQGLQVYLSDFGLARILGSGPLLHRIYQSAAGEPAAPKAAKKGSSKPQVDQEKLMELQQAFLQNYAFLAPEQKIFGDPRQKDSKADVYAFGVLVYYLLMKEFPEGYFDLPSVRYPHFTYKWDKLISQCLQADPKKRPDNLSDLLLEISVKSGEKTEQKKTETSQLKAQLKPAEIVRPQFEPDPGAIFQVESVVMRYQPIAQEARNIEPIMTDMVIIPGGAFHRGSNNGGRDEIPRHLINLSPFAIDIHPVTNEQFVRFLEVMGGEKDGNNNDMIRLRDSRIKRSGGKLSIESGYAKHPVVGVTWYGATAYAKWIGKRLPFEAEWEVAACGGLEEVLYPTGSSIERTQANFFSSDTTSVMSYQPNDYGIYDMAGNVYEWCQDWYDYHYYDLSVQEPDNPKGPQQGVYRVLRGGCWKSLKEDLRCAHRHRNNPGALNGTYGFRCVADVTDQ